MASFELGNSLFQTGAAVGANVAPVTITPAHTLAFGARPQPRVAGIADTASSLSGYEILVLILLALILIGVVANLFKKAARPSPL